LYIKQLAAKFQVDIIADDYCGAGEVREVLLLQSGVQLKTLMPIAYIPSMSSKMLEFVPASDKTARPFIKASKTKTLSIMAALMNKGYYSFPKFEVWDKKNFPNNLLSLVQEKKSRISSGASYIITHKSTQADDLAHAMNYASIAYWYITQDTPDFSKLLGPEFFEKDNIVR